MELTQKRIAVALASSWFKAVKLLYGSRDAFLAVASALRSSLDAAWALA